MRINVDKAVDTRHMTWMKDERTLTAEDSDFGDLTPYRLYDDSCDYGLWLRSHKSGNLVPFYYAGPVYDREGDVHSWNFANTQWGVKFVVYND